MQLDLMNYVGLDCKWVESVWLGISKYVEERTSNRGHSDEMEGKGGNFYPQRG